MTRHCKGCIFHHGNPVAEQEKYRDWCCKHSNHAKRAVSICLIQNSKVAKK